MDGWEGVVAGTYLDKVIEQDGSHGGQSEPNEDGERRDAGDVEGVEQMRGDDGRRLAEEERHEETLEYIPGNFRRFLWQCRYGSSTQ